MYGYYVHMHVCACQCMLSEDNSVESVFLESYVGTGASSHTCWYTCALSFVLLINLLFNSCRLETLYVDQVSREFTACVSVCWDQGHAPPYPASTSIFT